MDGSYFCSIDFPLELPQALAAWRCVAGDETVEAQRLPLLEYRDRICSH
jgi:hypothetical protein